VLTAADVVTVVTPGMKRSLEALAGREVHVIFNGFDPADFEDFEVPKYSPDNLGMASGKSFMNAEQQESAKNAMHRESPRIPDDHVPVKTAEGVPTSNHTAEPAAEHFIISHFGAFNRDRNPSALWTAMAGMVKEIPLSGEKLKIRLIGQTDASILQEIQERGLGEFLEVIPHLDHREGLRVLGHSSVLLLPLNDSPNAREILPGKMYEYMALRRPILAIGPTGSDCEAILTGTSAGTYHPFDDTAGMKNALSGYFHQWQQGELSSGNGNISRFSRRHLAGEIIQIGTTAGWSK